MTLSDRARSQVLKPDVDVDQFQKGANDRKREVYWIGFLQGALSSNRIESGEEEAILAEADKFVEFFEDPDASDLAEDIRARCFSGQNDLMAALENVINEKRDEIQSAAPYSERDEVNEFLGFCAGIVCDGLILKAEAEAMLSRFHNSIVLSSSVVFRNLWRALEAALADNVLTEEESEEVRAWIALLVGDGYVDTGIPNIGNSAELDEPIRDATKITLEGACVVLTGPMRMGTRNFIASEIERCGGEVGKTTTRKTNYLVVSSTASKNWRTTHFGTKIERAKELIVEGYKLRFITETALESAIRLQAKTF
ncbi:BRCT domain-containing protein [Pseudorhodobacter wandonensis]|uniref:BRCT domain-containing protein n=1 Tax=Pseudorhodobacter wandonensis TaxID=1120568 RepID=UPI00067BE8CF|nr:BRCT domain-containing protein [Pseudorhodobacter wandonensis]